MSYHDHAWFFEAFDLLRKWLLSAVVLLVYPNSQWQLVFGAFITSAAVGVNLVLQPYKERMCGVAASAALFQLQATYIIALAFYTEENESVLTDAGDIAAGSILVLINIACFVLFLAYLVHASANAVVDVGSISATPTTAWPLGKGAVVGSMAPTRPKSTTAQLSKAEVPTGSQYACFLSHYKQEAGSDARYLADIMTRMLGGTPVFLDSSALSDLRTLFTHGVHRSDALVLLATEHVLLRSWCLIEIFEAVMHKKPVLYMAIAGKGFTLQKARTLLSKLEDELADHSPSTAAELLEYFASASCVERTGEVSIGMLANTVLSSLPATEHAMFTLNLHLTDNRIAADVIDLIETMAERTGRKLLWKNRMPLGQTQLLGTGRSSLAPGGLHASGGLARNSPEHTMVPSTRPGRGRAEAPPKWFLCHHREKATVHARSMHAWLSSLLHEPTFLNNASLEPALIDSEVRLAAQPNAEQLLSVVLEEVRTAKAVLGRSAMRVLQHASAHHDASPFPTGAHGQGCAPLPHGGLSAASMAAPRVLRGLRARGASGAADGHGRPVRLRGRAPDARQSAPDTRRAESRRIGGPRGGAQDHGRVLGRSAGEAPRDHPPPDRAALLTQ